MENKHPNVGNATYYLYMICHDRGKPNCSDIRRMSIVQPVCCHITLGTCEKVNRFSIYSGSISHSCALHIQMVLSTVQAHLY